jgi:capsular polysaccharide biosynthesis protein
MNSQTQVNAVAFSEKVFRRLLTAYPSAHREKYGEPMAQLFRDQCRDAWNESHGWGLTKLWLRVLPDVVATSFSEHVETIKQRRFMSNRMGSGFRLAQFLTVFTAVFLLVVISATIITFILPESFAGNTRVLIKHVQSGLTNSLPYLIQTEFEVIRSPVVLEKVVEKLNLNDQWGKKYRGGERLATSETIALLKNSIDLRVIRNTSLIEIRGYSDKPEEAARIANSVADAYTDYTKERNGKEPSPNFSVAILERAKRSMTPVRPNKTLNIALGVIGGIVLGLIAATAVSGFSFIFRRGARFAS